MYNVITGQPYLIVYIICISVAVSSYFMLRFFIQFEKQSNERIFIQFEKQS